MTFIEGYMTGNAWEELCVKCYRLRYQKEHYTAIPAVQGGDAGIEGFTHNGIVHQCYCPERVYSDNDLYAHTYAVAYGFVVQQQNGNYKLTDHGKNFAERIKLAGDLMVTEIRELTDLSKRLTESRIKELTEIWRDRHAEN